MKQASLIVAIARRWSASSVILAASLSCAHRSQPRAPCPDLRMLANRLEMEHSVLTFSNVRGRITAQALLPDKQAPLKLLILPSFTMQRAVYLRPKPIQNEPVILDQGVPLPAQPEADEYIVVASEADWQRDRYEALLNGREESKVPEGERDDLWRRSLKVLSWSAPISKHTLHALTVAWQTALLGARPPPRIDRECIQEIRVDGIDYVFANRYLDGTAPHIPGPRIKKLIDLGESLAKYARAPEAQRATMEAKLQEDAAALQNEFDRDGP